MRTANRCLLWMLLILLLLSLAGAAQADLGSSPLRVVRSISTGHALPGSVFRVTLWIQANQDLFGVGIRERVPLGWTIHPVDNAESLFRQVDGTWVFPQILPRGTTRQLVYDVSVPSADALYAPPLPHCFSIQGTYQCVVPSVTEDVLGETEVEVVSFLPPATAIAHLLPGEGGAADRVDLRLSRVIHSEQLDRALEYWSQDVAVPHTGGEMIDHVLMGRLIAHYETCTRVDDPLPVSVDPRMEAVRRIETALPCTSILFPEGCHDPGEAARELTVQVEITVHHDTYGVSLKETLPSGWRVTPIDHEGFRYRPGAAEWVYVSRVRAGETLSIAYRVDVERSPADALDVAEDCCGRPMFIEGEAVSALECSVTQVSGDDRVTALFCLPVLIAISRWDPVEDRLDPRLSDLIAFEQMQRAVQFWQEGLPVPHTCGYTVGYEMLQRIVSYWLTSTPVTAPLPGDPPVPCPHPDVECRLTDCAQGWLCYLLDAQDPDDLVGLPEPPDVRVDAGPDRHIDCALPAVDLQAVTTGGIEPFRFEWRGPTGEVLGYEASLTVSTPGEYTVIAISCGGCMATDSIVVSADFAVPQVVASVNDLLTGYVPEVELRAVVEGGTAPLLIEWTGPGGELVGEELTLEVSTPGTYRVTVTGANGCAAEDTVSVVQDIDPPVVGIEVNPDEALLEEAITLTCSTEEIFLEARVSGGREPYSLAWLDGSGETLGTEDRLTVVQPGAYTLMVTGANGIAASATVNVLQDLSEPSVCASASAELTCAVNEVLLTVQIADGRPPFAITWFDEAGDRLGEGEEIRVEQPGEYTAVAVGSNGCQGSASVRVRQDTEPPTLSIVGETQLTCSQQDVALTMGAVGGRSPYQYRWLDEAGAVIGDEALLTVSRPGTYTAQVVGANGCLAEDVVTVEEDIEAPLVEAATDGALSCARSEVQLHANIVGGRLPLSIVWTDESGGVVGTSALAVVDRVGTYTVIVTGANGCSDTASVNVVEDMTPPTATVHGDGTLTCTTPEVTLSVEASGGRPPYTFEWRHPSGQTLGRETSQPVSDPGMYAVTVWGQNGCSTTVTRVVEQDVEAPEVQAFVEGTITCAVTSVELTACPTEGRVPYSYQWTDAEGRSVGDTARILVSQAGEYTVLVTGANGCTGSAVAVVVEDLLPPAICVPETLTLTCLDPVVTVDPSISSGRSPYTYRWTDECDLVLADTASVQLEFPGTYTLTVTGSNGCSSTATVRVVDGVDVPTVDAGPDRTLACLGDEVVLTATVIGGTSPYQYSWINACDEIVGTCRDLAVSTPGTYIVTVRTADGCIGVDTVTVLAPGT